MTSLTRLEIEMERARSYAATYERLAVPALFSGWASSLVDLAPPTESARALDIGCGTGAVARELTARAGPSHSVDAIDSDRSMVEVGRAACADHHIRWHVGDALRLPFVDGTFDVVYSQQALQFFDDPDAALAEMRRVTAPGGTVAISAWRGVRDGHVAKALGEVLAQHLGTDAAGELDATCAFGAPKVLAASLTSAGFEVRESGVLVEPLNVATAAAFLDLTELLTSLGPWLQALQKPARNRLTDNLTRVLGDPLRSIPIEASFAVGLR